MLGRCGMTRKKQEINWNYELLDVEEKSSFFQLKVHHINRSTTSPSFCDNNNYLFASLNRVWVRPLVVGWGGERGVEARSDLGASPRGRQEKWHEIARRTYFVVQEI